MNQGYIRLRMPEHPRANNGYVLEHIVVAELMLGRPLREDEVVHHRDHDKQNNLPENLEVMTDFEHRSLHMTDRHATG